MNNQKILEKAIQKAIDGGWNIVDYTSSKDKWKIFNRDYRIEEDGIYSKGPYACMECFKPDMSIPEIIFNHDFAKALWGDIKTWRSWQGTAFEHMADFVQIELTDWQFHLQQMVIADEPIKYLGENI